MFFYLLILFIAVPLIEVMLLMKISVYIGIMNTIALVLLTGITGALLAKSQGLKVLLKIESDIRSGKVPAEEVLDGVLILIGGITLLTPGFITDLTGFLLLIPYSRYFVKLYIKKRLLREFDLNTDRRTPPEIIDAEFEEKDD